MSDSGYAQLPRTGDVIAGKYALERLLGQGGMGAVYAARHLKLGSTCAIKLMLADARNHEAAQRFKNEGSSAAKIQNEHVVRVSDIDEEHGYAYMVLELLDGEDLAQVIERGGRLPAHVAVGYVMEALEGVRHAHSHGIVHRDLKPSNLFLARRQDGTVIVKVLDFGISKANNTNPLGMTPGQLTSTKAMLGSPLYMSPEQLRSSKSVDARADIWAMGIILYELMTGSVPFTGENLGELFAAILETDAPSIRSKVPEVPPGLDAIVARCLQRKPEHRYQTVAELERELAPYASAAGVMGAMGATGAMGAPYALGVAAGSNQGGLPGPGPSTADYAMARSAGVAGPSAISSSQVPVVKGTVPLGAITPEHQQQLQQHVLLHQQHQQRQTASSWQSTGSGTTPKSSSNGLVLGLLCGFVVLASIGIAGIVLWKYKPSPTTSTAGSANASSSTTGAPPAVPTEIASATTPPAAASSVAVPSASAPSSAAGGGVAVATPPKHHTPPPPVVKVVEPPKAVEPPKVAEPPKVVTRPPPATAPTPTSIQQTNR